MIEKENFARQLEKLNLSVSSGQIERFDEYAKMLVSYNEKVNLTALTSPDDIAEKHFIDSILPFLHFPLKEGASVIDVGTGAGFPSCPLKIIRDDISLTLVDSLNKRVNFLSMLSDALSLDAECIHARAEELGRNSDYRESFDVATARAVANLPILCEYCMPFVKVGGYFVALKGSRGAEEAKEAYTAIKTLGGKLQEVYEYSLPSGDSRTLLVIKKISQTPPKYPRNKGMMTKKPL